MRERNRSLRTLSAGHKQNGIAESGRRISKAKTWTTLEKTGKAISKAKWSAEEK